jgi:hypothetical protein
MCDREGRRVVSFIYKVVQKIKYDRLFFNKTHHRWRCTCFSASRISNSNHSRKVLITMFVFTPTHHDACHPYIFYIRPSFMGKPLLSHFAMISIIVSFDGLSLQFQISLQTNSSSFSFIRAFHIYQYSLSYPILSYHIISTTIIINVLHWLISQEWHFFRKKYTFLKNPPSQRKIEILVFFFRSDVYLSCKCTLVLHIPIFLSLVIIYFFSRSTPFDRNKSTFFLFEN